MNWRVVYYVSSRGENPVSKFLDECSKKQQNKILRIFQHLQEYGIQVAIPHIKKLTGTPFWEIRILGKDNIRIIYVVEINQLVVLLHGFFKKSQKTPLKEIEICYQRYSDFKAQKQTK